MFVCKYTQRFVSGKKELPVFSFLKLADPWAALIHRGAGMLLLVCCCRAERSSKNPSVCQEKS